MTARAVARLALRMIPFLSTLSGLGCEAPPEDPYGSQRRLYTGTDSMGVVTTKARTIPVHARPDLIENSGAIMSASQPGVIFTINDSGNEPILFALDTTGSDRGAWRVRGARNVDWEAISSGRCDHTLNVIARDSAESCIYIGDVGENIDGPPSRTIYMVREPVVDSAGSVSEIAAESLSYRYAEGGHDIEAMFVAHDGTVKLITKRPLRTSLGRLRPALIFAIPASAWGHGVAVARLVDSLAIVPGSAPQRMITDASLSRDGRYLAVRTYWQVYVFATDSATGRVIASIPPAVCNIASLGERQGEGISWYGSTTKLLLTSEGRAEPLRVVECPLPRVR